MGHERVHGETAAAPERAARTDAHAKPAADRGARPPACGRATTRALARTVEMRDVGKGDQRGVERDTVEVTVKGAKKVLTIEEYKALLEADRAAVAVP